jgi:hypothetical protein
MAETIVEPVISPVHSLDNLLESHPYILFAFAEKVTGVSMPIQGITTKASVLLDNIRGMDPINKKLINLLAIGGQTDGALGLMPPQVDATTLFVLKFPLIFHGIYLPFRMKLRGG